MPTSTEARNMELMQTLDDAWNEQNVEVFRARHKPDVIVRWPGQPHPTIGIEDHTAESIAFWKTFPDQRLDSRPYRVFFRFGRLDLLDRSLPGKRVRRVGRVRHNKAWHLTARCARRR